MNRSKRGAHGFYAPPAEYTINLSLLRDYSQSNLRSRAGLVPSSASGASRTGPQFCKPLYFGGCAQIKISRRGVIDSKNFRSVLKVGDPIHRFMCSESKSERVWYYFSRLPQKKHWMDLLQKPLPELVPTPVWEPRSGAERFLPVEGR